MSAPATVDAGEFGAWRRAMAAALRGDGGTDVPCGSCVGCCSGSWPIALRTDDAVVLPRVPADYVIEVAGAPPGVRYMGYRPDGTCPLLEAGRCTVYAHRPQTCRDFDCRLFAAAGLASAGANKSLIDARIAAWRFQYATDDEVAIHRAMCDAAAFLVACGGEAGAVRLPTTPVAIAGLAFKAYDVFLEAADATPETRARRLLERARDFERVASNGTDTGAG